MSVALSDAKETAPPMSRMGAKKTLVSAKTFECTILPPGNTLSGTLVPRALQKHGRRRIICIEVHRRELASPKTKSARNLLLGDGEFKYYEECIVRVLSPASKEEQRESKKRSKMRRAAAGNVDYGDDDSDGDDDASLSGDSTVVASQYRDTAEVTLPDSFGKWKAKYRFPIVSLAVKGTRKHSVLMEIDLGRKKEVREAIFDSLDEADQFQQTVKREVTLDKERTEAKMKAAIGDVSGNEPLSFLVEVVSGRDLPAADFISSDPFVSCLVNGKEVHRTEYISKTLDPVWTVSTGSLFIIDTSLKELFRGEGLLFVVYDYDKVGSNDRLGSVIIPPKIMYDAKGDRLELKLGPPPGKTEGVPGYLAVRIRRASEYDKEFMTQFKKSKASGGVLPLLGKTREVDETASKGGASNLKSMLTRRSRTGKAGTKNEGKKEFKIRPGPDPARVDDTSWMTEEALNKECLNESTNWIDAGTGDLGRIYIEILHCDGLPNLDTGGFAGNKTDTFVSLVHEDATVTTDIVDDCLSPRWMPWTKRAFIFHMLHPSSELFLGVFDYDDGINPTDDHDLVGRVSVDMSNLRKNTTYVLQYNIFTTARMTQRKQKGSITIRLRMEIDSDRNALLAAVQPPPAMYVNVKSRKEFRCVRYTCTGKYDMEKYSMKVINSYIEELLALQHVSFYIQDALMSLLLWRGTVNICGYMLPVHSLTAFVLAVFLVERPQLLPSFYFASIAWLMLATQSYRSSLPDVWSQCKTFTDCFYALCLGSSPTGPHDIKAYHNYEAAKEYLDGWKQRIEDAETAATQAYEEQQKIQEEEAKELEELGDTADVDIATKSGGGVGVSIDPFKSILYPVQQNLAILVKYVRHAKHILSWQECYIAFWVTLICLTLSGICLFVPWFFLIRWTARIIVWTVFGPWMKLADIFYVSKIKPLTEQELAEKKKLEREVRRKLNMTAAAEARVKREDQTKLKEMKKYMFGKFISNVPILKEDRYRDLPSPESYAVPYRPAPVPMSEIAMRDAGYRKVRIPGQHLIGDMIPKVETQGFTDAPVGQPTSNPALIDKNSPGGAASTGKESTAGAYMQLGSLVVVAGIITWFGVPFFSSMVERALSSSATS